MAWVLEKGQRFMAHVLDVVKASCPKGALAKRPLLVTVGAVLMTTAWMLRSRVFGNRHARI